MPERKWRHIEIEYDDGWREQIHRSNIDELEKIIPILEALNQAKGLRDKLNRILGE